jgi:predicted XRE-type DNA-binding protein
MSRQRHASVWDAIEDTAEGAASIKAKAALMMALSEHIRGQAWTQAQAAKRLHVTQPRVSDLMRGRIDLFSLDTLVDMAALAGLEPEVRLKQAA